MSEIAAEASSDCIVRLPAVYERDMDLLILEEFVSDATFRAAFVAAVMGEGFQPGALALACHSETSLPGESDLEFGFVAGETRWHLMIENKIKADFMPRQAERYRERGEAYIRSGYATAYATVLTAPASYLTGNPGSSQDFDATLSYETILAYFTSHSGDDARARHKARIIERAIERADRRRTYGNDERATAFWNAYRDYAEREFPDLQMAGRRGPRSAGAWAEFVSERLPAGADRIIHDTGNGKVWMRLPGMATRLGEVRQNAGLPMPAGARLESGTSSAMIVLEDPDIRMRIREPFQGQEDAARRALTLVRGFLL